MKIDVNQTTAEMQNEFEIYYNENLKYTAKFPFIKIENVFNIDMLREVKIYNLDGKIEYISDYNYLENLKEEFVPFNILLLEIKSLIKYCLNQVIRK